MIAISGTTPDPPANSCAGAAANDTSCDAPTGQTKYPPFWAPPHGEAAD